MSYICAACLEAKKKAEGGYIRTWKKGNNDPIKICSKCNNDMINRKIDYVIEINERFTRKKK